MKKPIALNSSVSFLGRIALGIALVGSGGLYIMRWKMQKKIRESMTYKEALQCLKENVNAVDLLGEPIKDKNVEIGDNNCYGQKDNVTWVTVPLEGRRRKGNLYYWVNVIDRENQIFQLSRVELSIDGTKIGRILLKDNLDNTNLKIN